MRNDLRCLSACGHAERRNSLEACGQRPFRELVPARSIGFRTSSSQGRPLSSTAVRPTQALVISVTYWLACQNYKVYRVTALGLEVGGAYETVSRRRRHPRRASHLFLPIESSGT